MNRPFVHPADDRFLRRTRNEQVRKSRRVRSLVRAAAWAGVLLSTMGMVALAAWGGRHYLTHSPRFRVRRVLVSGAGYTPEHEIRKVTDRYVGKNIFLADLEALQVDLEAQSWIRTAHAKRRVPDALLIAVEERVPEALARIRDSVYLADREGTLLAPYGPDYSDYNFPILTGLDRAGREQLRQKIHRGAAFVSYLYRTRPPFADQVSEIDLTRDDVLEMRLNDAGPPIRVSPEIFGLNLDNYLALRNYIASNYGTVEYVDLRWKDRISVRPAGGRIGEHGAKR